LDADARAAQDQSSRQTHLSLADVLPKREFAVQLRREKRRADRSKSPLSIVLFHSELESGNLSGKTVQLLELMLESSRETDVVGYLGEGMVAVLLPDTNAHGTRSFAEKVRGGANRLGYSMTMSSYPDAVFEALAETEHGEVGSGPLFLDAGLRRQPVAEAIKRAIDVLGAASAIVMLSPIMLATALAVAASSRGPVFYKQVRLGRGGLPFVFYKFRSMYSNVDDRIHREYVSRLIEAGSKPAAVGSNAWSKLQSDPRITPIGRFIRKTSLDELPQLFNVLKGDLSLVGPRPPIPYEVERYQAWHLRRILEIKPGVSGLWQVEARGGTTFEDMVRLDLRYVRMWSLALDLRIMLKTCLVVVRRSGAG
jgi:lipopolysaccharide/colanic/teichoic acid biosynthesis glycosyltransferase